jgi:hypothetical protein
MSDEQGRQLPLTYLQLSVIRAGRPVVAVDSIGVQVAVHADTTVLTGEWCRMRYQVALTARELDDIAADNPWVVRDDRGAEGWAVHLTGAGVPA